MSNEILEDKAAELARYAESLTDPTTQRLAGDFYRHGNTDIPCDPVISTRLYRRASRRDSEAKYKYADALLSGFGVRRNVQKALGLLEELSDEGDMLAQFRLVTIYLQSPKIPQQALGVKAAMRILKKLETHRGEAAKAMSLLRAYENRVGPKTYNAALTAYLQIEPQRPQTREDAPTPATLAFAK